MFVLFFLLAIVKQAITKLSKQEKVREPLIFCCRCNSFIMSKRNLDFSVLSPPLNAKTNQKQNTNMPS